MKNEIEKLQISRNRAITNEIVLNFEIINKKAKEIASDVLAKAPKENRGVWLSQFKRDLSLSEKVRKELNPLYLAKDKVLFNSYRDEYATTYFQQLYSVKNTGLERGYLANFKKYNAKQFETALNYPMSKLMDQSAMATGRATDLVQINNTIKSGIVSGASLEDINKALDITLGFRDSTGKILTDIATYKGQQYKTIRILRTEVLRMRQSATTDEWINQQDIVPSKLQLLETNDDKTRQQSADMDGDYADDQGRFLYPNGWHRLKESGVAEWDINDRGTTVVVDMEFEALPPTNKPPYQSFKEYADETGLKVNRYGQVVN
jgi:hypothetical protein